MNTFVLLIGATAFLFDEVLHADAHGSGTLRKMAFKAIEQPVAHRGNGKFCAAPPARPGNVVPAGVIKELPHRR